MEAENFSIRLQREYHIAGSLRTGNEGAWELSRNPLLAVLQYKDDCLPINCHTCLTKPIQDMYVLLQTWQIVLGGKSRSWSYRVMALSLFSSGLSAFTVRQACSKWSISCCIPWHHWGRFSAWISQVLMLILHYFRLVFKVSLTLLLPTSRVVRTGELGA